MLDAVPATPADTLEERLEEVAASQQHSDFARSTLAAGVIREAARRLHQESAAADMIAEEREAYRLAMDEWMALATRLAAENERLKGATAPIWRGVWLKTERRGDIGADVIVVMNRADNSEVEVIRTFADITDTIISHWVNLVPREHTDPNNQGGAIEALPAHRHREDGRSTGGQVGGLPGDDEGGV